MLLAVDIGNTNITIGLFSSLDSDDLVFTFRIATDKLRTADQYSVDIIGALTVNSVEKSTVDAAIISSVVPLLTSTISDALRKIFGIDAMIVGPGVKNGLDIKINNPAQLGADLVAVSVAAKKYYPLPNAVCDLGTASTITVLDKAGSMIGGVIYPGVRLSLNALVSKTSLLQLVSLDEPGRVIGKNTTECIQSGVIYGAAALLDGMISRIEDELGMPVTAIATGGLSRSIIEHCKHEFIYNENLILYGLRLIYVNNL